VKNFPELPELLNKLQRKFDIKLDEPSQNNSVL